MSVLAAMKAFAEALESSTGANGRVTVDVPHRIYDAAHAELMALTAEQFSLQPGERYGWPIEYRASAGIVLLLTSKEIENKLRGVAKRAEEATRTPGSEWGELEL